ncbi:MAG: NADH-quinone oxidoreductase subunit L [Oligoflexia bacterium]|nr:NADH-quinone oxidoreductase subunit L [Oligoflexia bacterium]
MLALILLFPLLGFLINGIWYAFFQARPGQHSASSTVTGAVASLAIFASFAASVFFFLQLHGMSPESRVIEQTLFSWIDVGALKLDFALRLDSLSTLFTLVITGVGTLIHIYSIGYMSHDAAPGKFFTYLNLFCFAMLILVLGASLPVMFLGWEGVGLCSYLLIGFWYTDIEKAKAGKKAFIVNRIGDFCFLLGTFMIFWHFGTLDFAALRPLVVSGHAAAAAAGAVNVTTITAICLLLFGGCCGKSAQIPLYVWLPDAMAGPTPVSALIHAATMVTSGIYLLARLNFMYSLSSTALSVIAIVGTATAFFSATIAITQTDIKKVLAYSTVSQLGYMFVACGVGAYTAGVFHVITHAFFKALLFLGAGSVIHGMHEEQNIVKMGGLRGKMPQTFAVFAVGWIAICGIPPFSGFFSKDEILGQAFSSPHGGPVFWLFGLITAIMTAFYMTRMFSLTFLGKPRFDEKTLGAHAAHGAAHSHDNHGGHADVEEDDHSAPAGVHESPLIMTAPLMVLAALSALGGLLGLPHASWLEGWLEPVIPALHEAAGAAEGGGLEWVLMGVSVVAAAAGIFFALGLYKDLNRANALAKRFAWLHKATENKWYIDEIYEAIFVRPIQVLSGLLWKDVDVAFIDRIVVGFGRVSEFTGQTVRVIQTGSIQFYALMLVMGVLAAVGYLLYGMV